MATVTLNKIDDDLFDRLERLAGSRETSVEDMILSVLRDALPKRFPTALERADAIAAMTPKGVVQSDSTLLIREARDL